MHQEPTPQALPPLLGMANLMRRCYHGENLVPLGQALLSRALDNPLDAHAYLDFSTVLQLTGNRAHGLAVQSEAMKLQLLYDLPSGHEETQLRLLVIMAPGDFMANTPVDFLVENSTVAVQLLYLPANYEWLEIVPEHDVMMVAVGESNENQFLLQRLARYITDWPRPVINHPENIAKLARDSVFQNLQGITGVDIPMSVRIDRVDLEAIASGQKNLADFLPESSFPIIVRPIDSHAGKNLVKINAATEIVGYLQRVPNLLFYLSHYVDYQSSDAKFRKYRIALIDGRPYLCHLAISEHWLVHYASAGMEEDGAKRAEEERCMENFATDFATRHSSALQAITERVDLSYFAIDCAENQQGELLLFEVDNAMVVHSLDSGALFPYKKVAMEKIFKAFQQMLANTSQAGTIR